MGNEWMNFPGCQPPAAVPWPSSAGRKGKLGDGMYFSLPGASSNSLKDSDHAKRRKENPDRESLHQLWSPSQHLATTHRGQA